MNRIRMPPNRRHRVEGIETALIVGFAALVVINGLVVVGGLIAGVGRMLLIMLRG